MTDMVLPQYGMGMADGTITVWHKAVGDPVEAGEPLCDVEAAKTTVEVGAICSGIVQQILFPAGTNVPVNTVIAVIGDAAVVPGLPIEAPQPVAPTAAAPAPVSSVSAPLTANTPRADARRQIEPRARRAARMRGIDLATIAGSGPGGRIIEEDVIRHAETAQRAPPLPAATGFRQWRWRCDAQPLRTLLDAIAEAKGTALRLDTVLVKAAALAMAQAGITDLSPALIIDYHDEAWLEEAMAFDPGAPACLSVCGGGAEWRISLTLSDQTMSASQAKAFCAALRHLLLNPLAILA